MEHVTAVREFYAQLLNIVEAFQHKLRTHQQVISSYAYQLGPLSPSLKAPSSFKSLASVNSAIAAFNHFETEAGESGKFVHRYPGVIAIKNEHLFLELVDQVQQINHLKKQIHAYITAHGKPTHIVDSSGKSNYVKNDLLYLSLPMKNHLMLTRRIDFESELRSAVSFSWNVDFIHRNISDYQNLITSLANKINEPPVDLSVHVWRTEILGLIEKIESHLQKGTLVKIIDPKPIEPVVFFSGCKKRIKAKLPVIVNASEGFYCRKPLLDPPKHPLELTKGRGTDYLKLSKYFYIYACY